MKLPRIFGSKKFNSSPLSVGSAAAKPGSFSSKPFQTKSGSPPQLTSGRKLDVDSASSSSDDIGSQSDKSSESSPKVLELQKVFRIFDTNGDGKISASELGSVLRSLGDNPTEEDLRLMVKEVDSDGDGFIDLEEFVKLNRDASKEDELQAAFCVFDIDKNGLITPDELYRVLMGMGEKELSMEACYRMIKGVDCDGDGFVSYNEFQKMMMTNP